MKKFLSIFMSLLLLICEVSTVPVLAVDNKVPDGYIGVYNIEDLYNIRFGLEKKYILMADIDMTDYVAEGGMFNSGIGWKPIGDNSSFFLESLMGITTLLAVWLQVIIVKIILVYLEKYQV